MEGHFKRYLSSAPGADEAPYKGMSTDKYPGTRTSPHVGFDTRHVEKTVIFFENPIYNLYNERIFDRLSER